VYRLQVWPPISDAQSQVSFERKAPYLSVEDRTVLRGSDNDMAKTIGAYRDAGLDEIIVSMNTADMAANMDTMSRFMEGAWVKV